MVESLSPKLPIQELTSSDQELLKPQHLVDIKIVSSISV